MPEDLLPPDAQGPPSPDAAKELAEYQKADRDLDLQAKREQIAAKRRMGFQVFWLVTVWLGIVIMIILFQGFGTSTDVCWCGQRHGFEFQLSEGTMIALITTTTANVALFLTIVIRHLFPAMGESK